jgi:hypothetical protein
VLQNDTKRIAQSVSQEIATQGPYRAKESPSAVCAMSSGLAARALTFQQNSGAEAVMLLVDDLIWGALILRNVDEYYLYKLSPLYQLYQLFRYLSPRQGLQRYVALQGCVHIMQYVGEIACLNL